MAISNYLRMLRSRRNITQAELARRLNKSRQAVNGFESESYEPTIGVANQIAAILDVPVSAIFQLDTESPVALIAQFENKEERDTFSEELMLISPQDKLQTVVLAREGACPQWVWDRHGERTDGAPGIAVPCTTKKQFDEMAIWLRKKGCKNLDCAIGIGSPWPYAAYFAADTTYARDRLLDWQPDNEAQPSLTLALDEFVLDGEELGLVIQALNTAADEAEVFANKCRLLEHSEYSTHYLKISKQMKQLCKRLGFEQSNLVRWSSEHSLAIEALHAAETKARNSDDMNLAKSYFETRQKIENQANTKKSS
jgi:putative transcriptional regulator